MAAARKSDCRRSEKRSRTRQRVRQIDTGTERIPVCDETVLVVSQSEIGGKIPRQSYLILKVEAHLPAVVTTAKVKGWLLIFFFRLVVLWKDGREGEPVDEQSLAFVVFVIV